MWSSRPLFEVALVRVAVQREKIKIIRVFERLLREIRLRRRQGALKIGDGFAFAFVQLGFNVVREHRSRPAMFDGLVGIPEAQNRVGDFFQQPHIVSPRDFCHRLWQILTVQFCHKLWQNL